MSFPSRVLMGGKLPGAAATSICGQSQVGVVAAGSAQGTATAVSGDIVVVATTPLNAGIIIPPAENGAEMLVFNAGANALSVYPAVGGAISGGATNAAFSVPAGKSVCLFGVDGINWYHQLSA